MKTLLAILTLLCLQSVSAQVETWEQMNGTLQYDMASSKAATLCEKFQMIIKKEESSLYIAFKVGYDFNMPFSNYLIKENDAILICPEKIYQEGLWLPGRYDSPIKLQIKGKKLFYKNRKVGSISNEKIKVGKLKLENYKSKISFSFEFNSKEIGSFEFNYYYKWFKKAQYRGMFKKLN